MLYDEYYLCCTVGATMLPLRYTYAGLSVLPMPNYRYTYAELLVPECYTFLVPFFQFVYRLCFLINSNLSYDYIL